MKTYWNKRFIYIREQQRKVILICFFLFFIPFIVLFSVVSVKEGEAKRQAYIASRAELNKQIQLGFDNILMSINRISYLHISDAKVGTILAGKYESKGLQYVKDNIYMNTLIDNLQQMNPLFYDITFISKNKEVFGSINTTDENKRYIQEKIDIMNRENQNYYVTPKSVRNVMLHKKALFTSLTRLIDYNKNTVGYLLVDIDFRDVQKMVDSVDNSLSKILLVDGDEILSSNDKEYQDESSVSFKIYEKLNKERMNTKEPYQKNVRIDGRSYICLVQPVTSIKANIIQYYENHSYFVDVLKNQGLTFFVCFLLMLSVLAFISRNSLKIFKPIEVLIDGMKETGKGNFRQIEKIGNIYEINLITERFNKMVTQLEQAVNDNYISKINQKNMELKMLQAQINPHFIYNTLNLISATAILHDVEEISEISDKLSSILRYNIKKGDIVLLHEEIQQVKDYLFIQRVRFSKRIEEEFEIDEELSKCPVLKFLLQPLVENCIFHGLELRNGKGKISIIIKKMENDISIIVSDNGIGISKEKLQFLQEDIRKKSTFELSAKDKTSIGITNVASRIRTFYGEQYCLEIESEEGRGTIFRMKLPIKNTEEEEKHLENFNRR